MVETNILKPPPKNTVSNSLVKLSHLNPFNSRASSITGAAMAPDGSTSLQTWRWPHLQWKAPQLLIPLVMKQDQVKYRQVSTKRGLLHILEMMVQSPTQPKLKAHVLPAPAWSWLFNCLWCSTGCADTNRWHLRHHGMIPWHIQYPPHQHSHHHQDDPQPLKLLFSMLLTSD